MSVLGVIPGAFLADPAAWGRARIAEGPAGLDALAKACDAVALTRDGGTERLLFESFAISARLAAAAMHLQALVQAQPAASSGAEKASPATARETLETPRPLLKRQPAPAADRAAELAEFGNALGKALAQLPPPVVRVKVEPKLEATLAVPPRRRRVFKMGAGDYMVEDQP